MNPCSPNVHLLKGNIKLNKYGALLILRNETWSFLSWKSDLHLVRLYLHQYYKRLAVLVLNSIQTDVEIISDGHLFLDSLQGKDEARTSSWCLNEAEISLMTWGWLCMYTYCVLCVYTYKCMSVPVKILDLWCLPPSLYAVIRLTWICTVYC